MDLTTTYMGLKLRNPIIAGSSKITSDIDTIKQCEEAGAGAIVLKSLFEEQILADTKVLYKQDAMYFWFPEAVEYMHEYSKEHGVKEYLQLIENAQTETNIPIIASVNCTTSKEWPKFAKELEKAGANGIELNIYLLPADTHTPGDEVLKRYTDIVQEVKRQVSIPVSLKIGYFFSNLYLAIRELSNTGVDALVLFNRYYRPDIDIENLSIISDNVYSAPEEVTLPLRWTALMSDKVKCDLGASTGIHDHTGVIKQLLAGAKTTQLATTLFKYGIPQITKILDDLKGWMKDHNYTSIDDFRGLVAKNKENTAAFERVRFMRRSTTV